MEPIRIDEGFTISPSDYDEIDHGEDETLIVIKGGDFSIVDISKELDLD